MKTLKIAAVIFFALYFIILVLVDTLIPKSTNTKRVLAGSVGSVEETPERIEELMRLKTWGVPSDLIMMVTTYQCETSEEALEKPFIFNALDFMFMTEVIKEYVHYDDDDGECTSQCGYETVAINYYWHRKDIKDYLGITNEEQSDLNASNLEEKARAVAVTLCLASGTNQIRTIQFNAISSDKFDYALELCGVEKAEDRAAMLELHDMGYFIDWLEEQAAMLGIDAGEGSTMVGSNGTHTTIAFMTAGDDTPFVDESFISPIIQDNWWSYVTCEIGGYAGHTGMDLGVMIGTPVRAAASGVVLFTGFSSAGYGDYCVINHGGKIATLYAHNSQVLVHAGQEVAQGDIIAYSGNTGNVRPRPTPENPKAGAHLHFEVIVNGVPRNPRSYLHKIP